MNLGQRALLSRIDQALTATGIVGARVFTEQHDEITRVIIELPSGDPRPSRPPRGYVDPRR